MRNLLLTILLTLVSILCYSQAKPYQIVSGTKDTLATIPIEDYRALTYGAGKERQCRQQATLKNFRIQALTTRVEELSISKLYLDSAITELEKAMIFSDSLTQDYENQLIQSRKEIKRQKRITTLTAIGAGVIIILALL